MFKSKKIEVKRFQKVFNLKATHFCEKYFSCKIH